VANLAKFSSLVTLAQVGHLGGVLIWTSEGESQSVYCFPDLASKRQLLLKVFGPAFQIGFGNFGYLGCDQILISNPSGFSRLQRA
jgi:hypothetical protein